MPISVCYLSFTFSSTNWVCSVFPSNLMMHLNNWLSTNLTITKYFRVAFSISNSKRNIFSVFYVFRIHLVYPLRNKSAIYSMCLLSESTISDTFPSKNRVDNSSLMDFSLNNNSYLLNIGSKLKAVPR